MSVYRFFFNNILCYNNNIIHYFTTICGNNWETGVLLHVIISYLKNELLSKRHHNPYFSTVHIRVANLFCNCFLYINACHLCTHLSIVTFLFVCLVTIFLFQFNPNEDYFLQIFDSSAFLLIFLINIHLIIGFKCL